MDRRTLLVGALGVLGVGCFLWAGGSEASESLLFASTEGDVVQFSAIEARHFRALAVTRDDGPPTGKPLLVRVTYVGAVPDLGDAPAWLRESAGVVLQESAEGAPVVFVAGDLATARGREALGATVSRGIAIETRHPALVPCVFAHELLHFLGLGHDDAEGSIMNPRCSASKPGDARLTPEASDAVDRLHSIRALTLSGRVTWAERL